MSRFTWLVTGASSGLGANIALEALRAGHGVIGTARNVDKAKQNYPDIETKGGKWLKLDVDSSDTQSIVDQAVKEHSINVVVNNAGYGLRGVLEDLSMAQIRAQIETNVFGALAVTKGAIPHFRQNRSGTIVNISSTSGMTGNAGYSLYAASKFALEGASESLAAELKPFNIRVLVVEPAGFRTAFQTAIEGSDGAAEQAFVSEPYRGTTADEVAKRISSGHGKQPGDPQKAGQAIVEVVTGSSDRGRSFDGLRLPLGKDAVKQAAVKIKEFGSDVEKAKAIAEWADFD